MKLPTLRGSIVQLEPLSRAHLIRLESVAFDPAIWRYMLVSVANRAELESWVDNALSISPDRQITWVTTLRSSESNDRNESKDRIVGSTRLIDIDPHHRTAEIGHTWINPAFHGTGVNAEAKLLQLTYAFEELELNRVAFKTHHENLHSQAAIRKLGAVYEGTFRNHYIMPDGSPRHSIWFSITRDEWPQVRSRLMERLQAAPPSV
ncbi:MAG TPA: GNAT family protein [Edaphobacter sp.]|nr:GNAT family protein [Edaphobacter sp.]